MKNLKRAQTVCLTSGAHPKKVGNNKCHNRVKPATKTERKAKQVNRIAKFEGFRKLVLPLLQFLRSASSSFLFSSRTARL